MNQGWLWRVFDCEEFSGEFYSQGMIWPILKELLFQSIHPPSYDVAVFVYYTVPN